MRWKPDDQEQTIYVPDAKTVAENPENNDHMVNAGEKTTIKDTITYTCLVPGKTYKVKGTLQYRDGLLKQLKTVMKDGKPLTAETTFTATAENGTVEVLFTFDATDLAGKTTVVFEDIYDGEYVIASHADPNDLDQSIYIPKIATKVGKKSGDYIIDVVAYKNLIPGRKYTVKGYFVKKEDGEKVKGSDGEITFTPDKPNGKIEVELDPVRKGQTLVAFESVYVITDNPNNPGEEIETLVGEHKDLNDKAQTLKPAASSHPKTGDSTKIFLYGGLFVCAAVLFVVLRRKAGRAQ